MNLLLASIQSPLPLCDWINIAILIGVPFITVLAAFIINATKKTTREQTLPFFPVRVYDVYIAIALTTVITVSFAISSLLDEGTITGESIISSEVIMALLALPAFIAVFSHSATPVFRPNKAAWFIGGLTSIYLLTGLIDYSGFLDWIHNTFNAPLEQDVLQGLQTDRFYDKLLFVISSVVLAPIIEETLFRGYFYPILRKYTNVPFAMLTVSLFFGAVHLSLVHFVILSFVGFVFNMIYEKTHSLRLSIAAHATFNALSIISYTLFL